MPPAPLVVRRAALAGCAGMAALALAWWGSLVADAAMGRAAWASPALGAVLLLAWVVVSWGGMARRARVVPQGDAGADHALYWQDAIATWQDAAGSPVSIHVVFDLGRFCLLKRVSAGQPDGRRGASFHWIDASPDAGHLPGPWRWRVMMASSRSSTPPPTTASRHQFPRPAGRPA